MINISPVEIIKLTINTEWNPINNLEEGEAAVSVVGMICALINLGIMIILK